MQITSQSHLRGNVKSFNFKHSSRKLGQIEFTLNSTSDEAGIKKAWGEITKMYKQKKKERKALAKAA